jgi:hypothetical protein
LVTADGDAELAKVIEHECGEGVQVLHDPNHYAKSLLNNFENLIHKFPVLDGYAAGLKVHFLIGIL